MATVATARLLARQWHKSHIKSKSTCQLLLSSPYSSIQQPAASSLVISNCCQPQNHHHWHYHQQQKQQKRYQSDHLKQRAIDALKSKKNANTKTPGGVSSIDAQKSPRNIVDKGGAISKNYAGGGKADGSKATQQPVTPPPVMASVKAVDDATMPETPPNPTPSSSSSSPSATTTPENITPSIALPVTEDNTSDSNVTDDDDASNKTTIATDDSNPWAHMHLHEFAPKIVVVGVGGAGTNAVNNMVASGLAG